MKRIKAVLLDVDGTLIDSNDAHAQAWVLTGAEIGFDVEFCGCSTDDRHGR
jgi:beta-phosphoglucomutase-like phosphatase (HAD superfamily)